MKSELPAPIFWAGFTASLVFGWWTLPVIEHPMGSDWGHYFTAAEFIWNPIDGIAYPDFRKPWFGWILGGIGQLFGYLAAGQTIGKLALMAMIGASALAAAALADRWAALVASWTVVLMPLAMDGALWVNHYPLLGATVGLAFAAGAAASRWPGLGWVAVAGLAAGASWALDFRGAVAIPVVVALVILGSQGLGWRMAIGRVVVLASMMGGLAAHDVWLQRTFDVPQLEVEQQLRVQRKGTLQQIAQGTVGDDKVRQLCENEALKSFELSSVMTPCGISLRSSNIQRLASMRLIPAPVVLLFGILSIIPMAWSRRGLLRSALAPCIVYLPPLLSIAAGMGWVTYFDRYILPFTVVLAVFVPVSISRFVGILPLGRWRGLTSFVLASLVPILMWPGLDARDLDAPESARSSEYHAGILAKWVDTSLENGDGVIDCAGLAIDSLLLPSRIDYIRFPPGDSECIALVKQPPVHVGRTYLITMHRDIPPHARATDLPFDPRAVEAVGWVDISEGLPLEGFRLWVAR